MNITQVLYQTCQEIFNNTNQLYDNFYTKNYLDLNEFKYNTQNQSNPKLSIVYTTDNSVSLTWASAVFSNFVSYNLYRSTEPGVIANGVLLATNLTSNEYTDTTVTDNKIYFYMITATNTQNFVTSSREIQIVTLPKTPNAPTVSSSGKIVSISWTKNYTSKETISYSVSRSRFKESGYTRVSDCTNITRPFTCSDIVEPDGAEFYYRISAENSNGSSFSTSAPTQITPITDLTAILLTATEAQVKLSWSGGVGASNFKVYRSLLAHQSSPSYFGAITHCTESPCIFTGNTDQIHFYTIST